MAINAERNTETTSTKKKLGGSPAAMANQPGGSVPLMSPSTRVPLGREAVRFANAGDPPSKGKHVSTSTMASLSKTATPLYGPLSAESPLINGSGGSKKRR